MGRGFIQGHGVAVPPAEMALTLPVTWILLSSPLGRLKVAGLAEAFPQGCSFSRASFHLHSTPVMHRALLGSPQPSTFDLSSRWAEAINASMREQLSLLSALREE